MGLFDPRSKAMGQADLRYVDSSFNALVGAGDRTAARRAEHRT